ncbi:hypothetical protein [Streptomyces netropsis]|uniref:hypothetical protein n=1 Tax=Streptomyces netropsis TaxID=55404 RepID=UPI001617C134|nr:hypothetical protein [Streptomyces netropsis]GGR16157.1 hypothetical protein GCM10010219_21360 [Streptomyces netropsis]
MFRHVIAPARFFSQVPNEIIRHPRLSSDAVRLLTWQLSLPDGVDQSLSETAKRAGIGKTSFIRAKRQLAAEGYMFEWRRQGEGGRWSTMQMVSNVCLTAEEAAAARDGLSIAPPTDGVPAAGEPKGRAVGRSQDNTRAKTDHPPTRAAAEVPSAPAEVMPGQVPDPLVERGAQALAAVSRTERRLRLTAQDVRALAPLAGEWLLRGATLRDLRDDLTAGLPERVHSAAGLVRDRLLRKMPEVPSFAEQEPLARAAPRAAGMRECRGEHTQPRLFTPVAGEVLCPHCRQDRAEAAQDVSGAIQATLRGAATVRAVLRGGVAG